MIKKFKIWRIKRKAERQKEAIAREVVAIDLNFHDHPICALGKIMQLNVLMARYKAIQEARNSMIADIENPERLANRWTIDNSRQRVSKDIAETIAKAQHKAIHGQKKT